MKRSLTIDLARGFTVLCIAPIHSLLVYSQPAVADSLIGKLLAFIAEWHGAQIFMFLMGISLTFRNPQPFQSTMRKSAILVISGYALNMAKFVIPYCFHFQPLGILDILGIDRKDPASHQGLQMLSVGDILHFAAIAYLITAMIYNQKRYPRVSLIAAGMICLVSPLLFDMTSCNSVINYILGLFTGQPPQTFFPVIPWLIYPLLGLWFGSLIKQEKPFIALDSLWLVGLGLLIIVIPLKYLLHDHQFSLFYRTWPLDTGLHVAAVFFFLSIWNWIVNHAKPNALFQLLSWCSKNITSIYLIQWVLIMWLVPVFGFRELGWAMSIMAMTATTCTTLALCLLFKMAFKKPR